MQKLYDDFCHESRQGEFLLIAQHETGIGRRLLDSQSPEVIQLLAGKLTSLPGHTGRYLFAGVSDNHVFYAEPCHRYATFVTLSHRSHELHVDGGIELDYGGRGQFVNMGGAGTRQLHITWCINVANWLMSRGAAGHFRLRRCHEYYAT